MRIQPLERDQADESARPIYDQQVAEHGRMTNMKKTLGHCGPALKAYMEWYELRKVVAPFLGERLTNLFAHAISAQTDCLICGTFFRRILMDSGENPDALSLDDRESAVVDFGRQMAKGSGHVSGVCFEKLRGYFDPKQIVAMTAFAGLMIATNVLNNALEVELDEYLGAYRKVGT